MIFVLIAWNTIGTMIINVISGEYEPRNPTLKMLNPVFIYQYHRRLNVFGTIMLALLYNLLSPVVSVIYWFCKLCTVGRK